MKKQSFDNELQEAIGKRDRQKDLTIKIPGKAWLPN
jgi:hypothetical protein